MLSVLNSLRDINLLTVLFRIALAFACGMVVGLERSAKNRPAGFRTHILVCIAAASASMVGHYIYLVLQYPADVSRIGAQVITGLGFIGAGTIFLTRKKTVKGLTTAAGLWATGIVGLAIGAGFYEGGLVAAGMILLVQTVVSGWGRKMVFPREFRMEVRYNQKAALDHVLRYSKDHQLAIRGLQINQSQEDRSIYIADISVRPADTIDYETLNDHFLSLTGVVSSRIYEPEKGTLPISTH